MYTTLQYKCHLLSSMMSIQWISRCLTVLNCWIMWSYYVVMLLFFKFVQMRQICCWPHSTFWLEFEPPPLVKTTRCAHMLLGWRPCKRKVFWLSFSRTCMCWWPLQNTAQQLQHCWNSWHIAAIHGWTEGKLEAVRHTVQGLGRGHWLQTPVEQCI